MKALYRIVAALAAALAFPALYFMKLIRVVIEMGFMEGFFDDSFSLEDLVGLAKDYRIGEDGFEMSKVLSETLMPLKNPAIVTLVFLCLTIAMVLAVLFCSIFTNAKKVNLVFSALGAVAALGTIISFNSMTDIVISGTLPLGHIVNALLADSSSIIAGIAALFGAGDAISLIGELKVLQLGSAFITVLFIFAFEIIWALSFILINMDEYKTPKANKKHK